MGPGATEEATEGKVAYAGNVLDHRGPGRARTGCFRMGEADAV